LTSVYVVHCFLAVSVWSDFLRKVKLKVVADAESEAILCVHVIGKDAAENGSLWNIPV
jgi:pyruvate/2-oxoglutarate dehydrogenase complex dihydrolipoamide dehydrogenase (E3) component